MRIAQLVPLWLTIPPKNYGGIETTMAYLVDEQVNLGHDVTLFTCAGSNVKGRMIEVIDRPMYELLGKFDWSAVYAYEFLAYYELLKRIDEFDIVHNHMGFHFLAMAPAIDIPIVTTNHSSIEPDFPYLAEKFKDENYVSESNAQRANVPYLNYVATIYSAVQPEKFKPNFDTNQDYFFNIGNMSKNKGVDIAVKAAHELGEKLILAGDIRPEDQEFWDKEVAPMVDGERIKFIGRVNHDEKVELFRNSKGLLFPTQWNEAFGMVAIESMASATPVIGWEKGALPEIIKNGETGFIVNSFEDFKKAMQNIGQIDRKKCVDDVNARFSARILAQNYIDLYTKLINQGK